MTDAPVFEFTTLAGDVVHTPLNLTREQWEAYNASPDTPNRSELWELAEALMGKEDADKLGVIDVTRWGIEWSAAFLGALGLGESDGSTEPSTVPTAKPSRSTSGGSRKPRSSR